MTKLESSDWKILEIQPPPANDTVLGEILDGGQAFRWRSIPGNASSVEREPLGPVRGPGRKSNGQGDSDRLPHVRRYWAGVWADCSIEVRLHPIGIEWRTFENRESRIENAVRKYFSADRNYDELTDRLPWRSDPHLAKCLEEFRGLRLLHQPFDETLLGFLCSATKQIVQIRQMMALLADRFGDPQQSRAQSLEPGAEPVGSKELSTLDSRLWTPNALPSWERLATVPEAALRGCLLGFRAGYIHKTALFLAERPGWLDETERTPYAEAKERLCQLPGVGEKIADCVLLYGAGRLEAFPVDVWILRAMADRYGLSGWKPAQVAHFGRAHFGAAAGLAQQYLFAYERAARGARRMTNDQ